MAITRADGTVLLGWLGAWCLLLGLSHAADAQQVLFLDPEGRVHPAGSTWSLHLARGALGETAESPLVIERSAWREDGVDWFFVRAAGTQENRDDVVTQDEKRLIVPVTVDYEGIAMIGLDLDPYEQEVEATELSRFLSERLGPRAPAEAAAELDPDRPVLVRRIESAKTFVQIGVPERIAYSGVALSKAGQRAEFRPIINPTTMRGEGDLLFRLYLDSAQTAGTKVIATHAETGTIVECFTDADGLCRFHVERGGEWRLEAHAARQLAPPADAPAARPAPEWEIASVTLTFRIPEDEDSTR